MQSAFDVLLLLWDQYVTITTIMDKSPWNSNAIVIFFLSLLGSLIKQGILFEIFLQFSVPPPYIKLKLGKKIWIHASNIVCGARGGVGPVWIEIVAKVESVIRPLDTEQTSSVRRTANNLLQKAQPPKPNITKGMKQALKGLKEDDAHGSPGWQRSRQRSFIRYRDLSPEDENSYQERSISTS